MTGDAEESLIAEEDGVAAQQTGHNFGALKVRLGARGQR